MPLFSKAAATSASPSTVVDLLPPEYGLVLIVAGALVMEGLVLGSMVMKVRKQVFTSREFEAGAKDLLDEHKKAFPNAPFALGYPDMGSGRFSQRLTYAQWFAFNTAQRGHQNFLESAWGVMPLLLVGGLFNPRVYAGLGAVYLVARFLYAVGYAGNKGPKGREAGAIAGALSMLGMVLYTIYTGVGLLKAGAK